MKFMTEANDNESKQLAFPIQEYHYDNHEVDDATLIQAVRLGDLTRLLNLHAEGKFQFDLKSYGELKQANDIFIELGYPQIISQEDLKKLI